VSVAVQVDSTRVQALAEAAGIEVAEIEKGLQTAIEAAAGYNAERKDVISLHMLPFAEAPWVDEQVAEPLVTATLLAAAPHAVAALGLLLLFLFVVRPVMARVTAEPVSMSAPGRTGDLGADMAADIQTDPDQDLANRLRLLVDNYQPVDASDLNRLVNREAPAAAQVLRQWKRSNGD
jgi:flagellar biosynthesis/type III secretory pathway M-ring protein FliF/YscJ